MKEQFTFFWGGVFSQWYKSDFTIDDHKFNCCEQYMMWRKAILFEDDTTAGFILKSSDARHQKALGRLVENFDVEKWNAIARDVVYKGNYEKFSQNSELMPYLLDTSGTTLVEASKHDKIWGIGLVESDPRANNRDTWQGTNWLGEVLTKVRDDILKDIHDGTDI